MGDVLAELEDVLRSKPTEEKITAGEELVLQTCKSRAIRDFTLGAGFSSAVVWTATRRLTHGQRFNISVGSAMLTGMWRFDRSLNSCLDQILGLEGSRMQRELTNIILTKHRDNVSRVQLVGKHFYPEQVFNDLNPDKPFLRWRSRNLYMDNTAVQKIEGPEDSSYHDKPDIQPRYSTRSLGGDMLADPLDCIFGYPESNVEITHSDEMGTYPRRRLRSLKRAHRRHRAKNSEFPSDHANHQD
ncbi:uncharacterized protein LOC103718080 [Phoenix dactylifera]|uniref:Uncharacterized protein LOC103718080 n=1 Tax=Phoenix dactylifera TaxID=42345 RepID=A0A8B7CSC7_PHODC|nr:uncharacterized protein LOC103718080 [Phoenix dactylifera]